MKVFCRRVGNRQLKLADALTTFSLPPPISAMEPLTWSIVRHPDFLGASSSVDDTITWVLDHADPSLLLMGVLHIPLFSESGAARLAALTETLLGQGGDGVDGRS